MTSGRAGSHEEQRSARAPRQGAIDRLGEQAKMVLSTASLVASNLFVAVLAVVTIHVQAQHLGSSSFGRFTTVTSFVMTFALLADLGITTVTTRDLAADLTSAPRTVGTALAFRVGLSLVLAPIMIGTAYLVYPAERRTVVLGVVILSSDLVFVSVQAIVQAYYSARVRNDVPSLLLAITKTLYFAGTIIGVETTRSVLAFVTAYVAADALMAIVSVVLVNRHFPIRPAGTPRTWWQLAVVAFPLGATQVVNRIYSRLDSVLLSLMKAPTAVADYGIAFSFTDALTSLPAYIMSSVMPSLVRAEDHETLTRRFQSVLDTVFWISAPIAVGGIELRAQIVDLVAGAQFHAAAAPMAILMVSTAVSFPQVVFASGCVVVKEYRLLLPAIVLTTLTNLAANLLLIPPLGPSGAAIAQCVTESLSLVLSWAIFRWRSHTKVRWRRAILSFVVALCAYPASLPLDGLWHTSAKLANPFIGAAVVAGIWLVLCFAAGAVPRDVIALVPDGRLGRRLVTLNGGLGRTARRALRSGRRSGGRRS